jgi:formiminoglutamase
MGRTGAYGGPDAIRAQMRNFPVHGTESFGDAGNICCTGTDLESAQKMLSAEVHSLLAAGTTPIVLGGGHEVAWGHYQGIRNFLPRGKRLGILNIDAHFDLRIPKDGNPTSGTSFWHMYQDCKGRDELFNYMVVGIQESGNTRQLFETARMTGTSWINAAQVGTQDASSMLTDWIASMDCVYLTICLDVFSMAIAPGVSAPAANGLFPGGWLTSLFAALGPKLISLDVAEMNPTLDIDHHTARLAANLIYQAVNR